MSSPSEMLSLLLTVFSWLVIARALLSWVQPRPSHPALVLLHRITEPLLAPFRKLIPPRVLGGLDLSPIAVLIILQSIQMWLR